MKLNGFKLWDEILYNFLCRDDSVKGDLRYANYYVDLKAMYSGDNNVTFMYTLDGYPQELDIGFRSQLRSATREGVRISFVSTFEKHKIPWDSPQMKAKLRTWQVLEGDIGDVNEYNLHENLKQLDSTQRRKESLTYLSEADIRRQRKLFVYRTMLFVSGQRGVNFDDTVQDLKDMCKSRGLKLTRVLLNIQDFLKVFSPFSLAIDPKITAAVGNTVLPDEMLARFGTYSQGTVGKRGLYWGTDIYSGFPCLKPFKITSESAENIIITAETGGGKSYFVKGLLMQILANRHYNGTIMDIEGFEYIPLAKFLGKNDKVEIINMAEGQGAYFDPVEILLTGDSEIDKGMYGLSTSFTMAIFKTLLGEVSEQNEWIDIALGDAVSLAYTKRGVIMEDMKTWGNSKGLTLFDVYACLKDLTVSDGSTGTDKFKQSLFERRQSGVSLGVTQNDVNRLVSLNPGYQKALEFCLGKVSRYFEKSGVNASLFKNRIPVHDVIAAKLVICSFGMAGKSEANVDKIQMALMQLCAANISYLRSVFSKSAGKYNFKLWEEFQRWGGFPDADKTITTALTGGRKLGDINIIVTNNIADMLKDDKFGVFSNVQSIAIGCIGDAGVREALCKRLSIEPMKQELDKLAIENKDMGSYVQGDTFLSNPYSKAFLIGLDKTVHALSRMSIPADLAKSDIFRTGINLS
ncbi:MAG: hypothetical protein LBM93_10085 [Oscillospiraceae bacterium]|nr:hypothetical protein [Oscillospiraceae bacterium]